VIARSTDVFGEAQDHPILPLEADLLLPSDWIRTVSNAALSSRERIAARADDAERAFSRLRVRSSLTGGAPRTTMPPSVGSFDTTAKHPSRALTLE
jgi:hypothetical protein